ncbi:protein Cep89 homolog [Anastrepha obliqua]|uniref:protein Cep89 homolog n=1 Tax=Anastrepha obliqua TaxID=95512 RepID=UPI00240A091A|nr:protein Cep89 homolog [Anastrepha obliqua]
MKIIHFRTNFFVKMASAESGEKHVIITDLDLSDCQQQMQSKHPQDLNCKPHKKRHTEKQLHTISGNFNRRSRSAEHRSDGHNTNIKQNNRVNTYFNELLQSKEKQLETILQRLATLHKFNEQFDVQNKELRAHIHTLEERIDILQDEVANCGRCQELIQQLANCSNEKQAFASDVDMMQTLVYRLNVQIESYQDRLRLSKDANAKNITSDTGAGDMPTQTSSLSTWEEGALRTHTLSPLLQSYDEMIRDKEQLIQQYGQEFEHFTGELKRVLEENNRLLQQNESQRREVGSWREERTRMQAQVDVCRAKVDAQTKKSDLAKEKLVEVMHCYEQKMQSLVLDMEHLQSAYTRCKNELASLKSIAQQPPDSMAHALQECKTLLEQLKEQHSSEKQTLESTIEEFRMRHVEDNNKLAELKMESKTLVKELELQRQTAEELQLRTAHFQRTAEKIKRSRDRLKARLRIALQWAQKMEEGQENIQSTWDALKRLETIVKHKESQVRGLHARHLQEIDKMQKKLFQKEETIRNILKGKLAIGEQVQ